MQLLDLIHSPNSLLQDGSLDIINLKLKLKDIQSVIY